MKNIPMTSLLAAALSFALVSEAPAEEEVVEQAPATEEVAEEVSDAQQEGEAEDASEAEAGPEEEEKTPEQLAREELERLQLEQNLRRTRFQGQISELEEMQQRMQAELQVAQLQLQLQQTQQEAAHAKAQQELRDIELQHQHQQRLHQMELEALEMQQRLAVQKETAQWRVQMEIAETRERAESKVLAPVERPEEPFVDGVLHISDRRIPLNGPIWPGTADYVTERIHYYNNQSDSMPIFIVIDVSPGGSVMEGVRILEAIENSQGTRACGGQEFCSLDGQRRSRTLARQAVDGASQMPCCCTIRSVRTHKAMCVK